MIFKHFLFFFDREVGSQASLQKLIHAGGVGGTLIPVGKPLKEVGLKEGSEIYAILRPTEPQGKTSGRSILGPSFCFFDFLKHLLEISFEKPDHRKLKYRQAIVSFFLWMSESEC